MPPSLSSPKQPQEVAKEYIAEHRVHQMFSSLLSALIMHKPEDPIEFIQTTLDQVKVEGKENVNWETFIYNTHPYRDPVRLDLIRDDSKFQQEKRRKEEQENDAEKYDPQVFKLTEGSSPATPSGGQ